MYPIEGSYSLLKISPPPPPPPASRHRHVLSPTKQAYRSVRSTNATNKDHRASSKEWTPTPKRLCQKSARETAETYPLPYGQRKRQTGWLLTTLPHRRKTLGASTFQSSPREATTCVCNDPVIFAPDPTNAGDIVPPIAAVPPPHPKPIDRRSRHPLRSASGPQANTTADGHDIPSESKSNTPTGANPLPRTDGRTCT